MDLYTNTSYELSKLLTLRYSTSFSSSSKLFARTIQPHIFAIYGLVRIADEIVDTYEGSDKRAQLDALEQETYTAMKTGYSANPIVHAFALTAVQYDISAQLIAPFFESMRMDLTPQKYDKKTYETYIHGSAEVIGLMCLRVFVEGDSAQYDTLSTGAKALGSAYQKINFLRDIASDFNDRQRVYFPGVAFETFNDVTKEEILEDIRKDFRTAHSALLHLPITAQKAVKLSVSYYYELLKRLERTPSSILKKQRVRVPTARKIYLRVVQPKPNQKDFK